MSFLNASSVVFQEIARDAKLMDTVFAVATAPSATSMNMTFDETAQKFVDPAFATISMCVKLAWRFMEKLFQNNEDNEGYFADQNGWINPGLVNQIADPVGAAIAFGTLISSNKALLEKYVDKSVIQAFIRLIKERGPQARLMDFFSQVSPPPPQNSIPNLTLPPPPLLLPRSAPARGSPSSRTRRLAWPSSCWTRTTTRRCSSRYSRSSPAL
jgi:hypothetical protein